MFELEYCDDPKKGEIKSSGITFDNSIAMKYEKACKIFENYMYLIDRFNIIQSCADDLLSVNTMDKDYWKVNKALLNYVNAVYSFKEMADCCALSIKSVTEKYYQRCQWYRFVCDFRNSVIHESVISTDYDKEEAYIILNTLIDILNRKKVKPNQEDNRKRQIIYLEAMKEKAKYHKGVYYYGIKRICKDVSLEIEDMKKKVINYALEENVMPELEWLFSIIYKHNGEYMYSFIIDKENGIESVCEPNYILENFFIKLKESLGEDSEVFRNVKNLFELKKYDHFFG